MSLPSCQFNFRFKIYSEIYFGAPTKQHLTLNPSNETRQQMEARMATLENTITNLMGTKKDLEATPSHVLNPITPELLAPRAESETLGPSRSYRRKRTNSGASGENGTQESPSSKMWSTYTAEPSYSTPPFSAVEAQNMIQQVLSQGKKMSKQKRDAYHSALGSLSESLNTSYHDTCSIPSDSDEFLRTKELLENSTIPDVEVVQVGVPEARLPVLVH